MNTKKFTIFFCISLTLKDKLLGLLIIFMKGLHHMHVCADT